MNNESVIQTRNLTKYFGGKAAVYELNLDVPRGCVFAFLGRNGSGKTTTIRMLMGMVQPTRGTGSILGQDIRDLTPEIRARIGYLTEEHQLYGWMNVKECGEFQSKFFAKWNNKIFRGVVGHFGLKPEAKVKDLSRGERAGLCLALTLAPEPELLMLDDPGLGLDPVARRALVESMIFLTRKSDRTIFFSSHHLSDVERTADYIAVFDRSILRACCPLEKFREGIQQVRLRFPGTPPALPKITGLLQAVRTENELRVTCIHYNGEAENSLRSLSPVEMESVPLGLEDAFISYLTLLPGGRYQVQEASYDPKSNQWFYVYGDDLRFPGEFGHWTGRGMNWNSMCAECHNTRLKKNYDPATDSYHTTMAEMAVGCEACHGPLKAHNEWQKAHTNSTLVDPTVVKSSPTRIVGLCGSCHSRNTDLTENFKPGDSFYDHYSLEILDDSKRWYPDGQIKDEDYEFVSFLSSKMYQDGVTCLDCHNPHSYKNTLQGNDLCMRCHNGGYPKAPKIDPASHTHECKSDCIGCHMPVTVYMQRDARRDHGFTIPDPLLTRELNIPNACNRCHADQTTDWALKYTDDWYGAKMNRPTRDRARWIAAAENGEAGANDKLTALLADTNQPPYWRAVAATFLEQWAGDPATKTALLAQLKNEHPLVRERVVRSLEPIVNDKDVQSALKPMLDDPLRNVRMAAAWVSRSTVDMQSQAGQDLQRMLDLDADQPDGQFQEAMLLLARQQPDEALTHLKKATAWDPLSPPFLCTQAEVQDQLGQLAEALKTLDQAEAAVPDDPHIPYVRAMILAHDGHYDEARTAANRALKIQPDFKPALELLQGLPASH